MPDLIQNSKLNFAQLRSDAAEAAVLARRLSGEIQDDVEARALLKQFLTRVKTIAGPVTAHPDVQEFARLDSNQWNTFQEHLHIDLSAIYDALVGLEAASRQMEAVVQADLTQTKAAILKAISQLEVYQFLKDNPEYQDMKTVDFIRSINDTRRRPAAVVDGDIRMLELPAKSRQVASASRLNGRRTRVTTKVFGPGKLTGFGEQFAPKNIINPNKGNFWVEVMSTKAPVQQVHATSWGKHEIYGVVAEVTLDFSHVERVNNLKLLPFSEFPYDIIDIAYRESATTNEWKTLPGFVITEAVEDWTEFDFTYIAVDQLRVTISQPNYIRNISLIPESLIRKNNLLSQLQTDELVHDVHELSLTTREAGRIIAEPEQLRHLVALERFDSELKQNTDLIGERHSEYEDYTRYADALGRVVDEIAPGTGNQVREPTRGETTTEVDPTRQIVSYDYTIGISVIQLATITYQPLAYYESPEFVTNGTVVQVQLDSDEIHPVFLEDDDTVAYRQTSIEYEIETSPDTRFPILPISSLEGENYIVRDEWVRLTRNLGRLRFTPVANAVTVRRNGTRISMLDVTVNGRDIHVTNADRNAIYTVTYSVGVGSTKVDVDSYVDSTKLLTPESFEATDADNKVVLSSYPYIAYEIVRDTLYWTKKADSIWEWNPDFLPLSVGSVALTPGSTGIVLTKDSVSDPGFTSLVSDGAFPVGSNIKIWIQETNEILDVDMAPGASITDLLAFLSASYEGDAVSSSRFIIGRTVTYDNVVYGLNIDTYEPIKVLVNGVRATNVTDYYSRQHPSFAPATPGNERQYEFIQAGKVLYFNGPVDGTIEVTYNWLTQYLKLVATLRCHVPVTTIFTPKINRAKMRVKTTEL